MSRPVAIIKPGTGVLDSQYSRHIVLPTLPVWHELGATPNVLTTLGLLSSLGCIYATSTNHLPMSLLLLAARMYFDYADGMLARKYGQSSSIGDYYDHVCDFIFGVGIVVALCRAYPRKSRWIVAIVLVTAVLLQLCQHAKMQACAGYDEHSNSLTVLQAFDTAVPDSWKVMLDYFDGSLFYVAVLAIMIHKHSLVSPQRTNDPV